MQDCCVDYDVFDLIIDLQGGFKRFFKVTFIIYRVHEK